VSVIRFDIEHVLTSRSGFVGQRCNWTPYGNVAINPPLRELFGTYPGR
jgi:hypothetical protein